MDNDLFTATYIDHLIARQVSFAFYRLPWKTEPEYKIQYEGGPEIVEKLEELNGKTGFVIAPFNNTRETPLVLIKPDLEGKGWKTFQEEIEKIFPDGLVDGEVSFPETPWKESTYTDKERYLEAFNGFIVPLKQKKFEKLVLSRPAYFSRKEDFSVTDAFIQACNRYPRAFVYLCYTPQTGTWLGSTPEILLSGDRKRWHTIALAGTMPQESGKSAHSWSVKNKKEQAVVADYIRRQLKQSGIEPVEDGPYTVQAGPLVHLRSDFCFTLPDNNRLGELLALLYPTPAVCGLPKEAAFEFILEREGYNRKYYSGFIGWLAPESRSEIYVNLRCMEIKENILTLYAGSGIMPDSDAASEWEETEEKMRTMKALIME